MRSLCFQPASLCSASPNKTVSGFEFWVLSCGRFQPLSDSKPKTQNPKPETAGAAAAGLHPADQQLALIHHFLRQVRVEIDEQFLVTEHLGTPRRLVEGLQLLELL